MAFWVVSLSRVSSSLLLNSLSPISLSLSRLSLCRQPTTGSPCNNKFTLSSFSLSTQHSTPSLIDSCSVKQSNRWRPMCLYYTQGKCTKLDDASHIEKFNHNCSWDLDLSLEVVKKARPQKLDYFLVLDLEGKVEILEFPVLMIDAKTMAVVDIFHRFVRPSVMNEQRINEYIEGKYGKLGVDRVWHDTAIPFDEVINQFEDWMCGHNLWGEGSSGCLTNAAFVTCGNWDLKTKVPQQCKVLKMNLPSYFMAWINLKDVYLNFYKRRATGMVTMMRELGIPLMGSHHLGIDDTKNIARVVQRMLMDGALLRITAKRSLDNFENIEFLFRNRIR